MKPSVVKRFKDSHHLLARLFAAGLRPGEVAARAGYSNSRVSILCADPAFQELIAGYRVEVDEGWLESVNTFMSLATANMVKAERMLADKLDEAEDEQVYPSVRELVMVSADRADRFGFPKRSTQVNLNVDFAAQLDRAVARSGAVIEARPIRSMPAALQGAVTSGSKPVLDTCQQVLPSGPARAPVEVLSPSPPASTGAVLPFKRRF